MKRFSISVDNYTYAAVTAIAQKTGESIASVCGECLRVGVPKRLEETNVTKKRVEEVLAEVFDDSTDEAKPAA